jgi:hypothetical protein
VFSVRALRASIVGDGGLVWLLRAYVWGVTEPVLPETTSDERVGGWGDDLGEDREHGGAGEDSDDERFLEERPPHHDRD